MLRAVISADVGYVCTVFLPSITFIDRNVHLYFIKQYFSIRYEYVYVI